jgi:hypothetical protein
MAVGLGGVAGLIYVHLFYVDDIYDMTRWFQLNRMM